MSLWNGIPPAVLCIFEPSSTFPVRVDGVRRETRRSLTCTFWLLLLRSLRLPEPVLPHRATWGHDLSSLSASVLVPKATRDFMARFRVGFLQIRRVGPRVAALTHGPDEVVAVNMRRLMESRSDLAHRGVQTAASLHDEGGCRGTRSCRHA